MLAVGPTLNSERGPFCIERWTLSVFLISHLRSSER